MSLLADIPYVPVPVVSALVKHALQRCPRMNTLGVFVRDESLSRADHYLEQTAFSGAEESLAHILAQARTLENVTGSTMLFDRDIFEALGRLPSLAHLDIWYPGSWDRDEAPPLPATQADDDAFPALNHLSLHNVTDNDINYLWGMGPLVKRLTSLDIAFNSEIAKPDYNWVRRDFIPLICHNSTQITRLQLDFDLRVDGVSCLVLLTEETFRAITALPLTVLTISGAKLGFGGGVKRLATSWPAMEVLVCTLQVTTLEELQLFAKHMPRLRHLGIEIDMVPLPLDLNMHSLGAFQRPLLRELESRFDKISDLSPERGLKLYRYFKTLWPHAHLTTPSYPYKETKPSRRMDLVLVHLLNEAKSMKYFSDTPRGSVEVSSVEEFVKRIWEEIVSA
ncbi:hypothetical protein FRC06_008304, partial [Ceratobasidium sp. 370]